MSPKFTIIEKIIAALLLILAGIELSSVFWQLQFLIKFGIESKQVTWESISFIQIFKNYHLSVILSLLTLLAATSLLFSKKIGWLLSVSLSIIHILSYIIHILDFTGAYKAITSATFFLVTGAFICFYLSILVALLQKEFKVKYNPSSNTWRTIIFIAGIYLTDRILLFVLN